VGLLTHGALRRVVERRAHLSAAAVPSELPPAAPNPSDVVCDGVLWLCKALGLVAPESATFCRPLDRDAPGLVDWVVDTWSPVVGAQVTHHPLGSGRGAHPWARDVATGYSLPAHQLSVFTLTAPLLCFLRVQLDLLVSDVNMHPSGSLRAIAPLLPLVKPHGWLVLTMKNFAGNKVRATGLGLNAVEAWCDRTPRVLARGGNEMVPPLGGTD
jgi:hypothetical protein